MLSALVASRLCPMLGKVADDTGVCVGHLLTMRPSVVVWVRVESALSSSFSLSLFRSAVRSRSSLAFYSSCLAKCALASVSVATTPRSVAVTVARLAKAPMVASAFFSLSYPHRRLLHYILRLLQIHLAFACANGVRWRSVP
jgi:hypothetical protein